MPPTNAPAELNRAAVARFGRDLAALVARDARVLVAVSGGPDSVALLLLAHQAIGDRCVAATVDHGLRAESRDEAAWVARLCATRGIAHTILTAPLPPRAGRTTNLSARARTLRYALLEAEAERIGADRVATAHHADDQIETLVMRLNRGAGVAGLAGVRATGGRIVRPLLGWRKAELAGLVTAQGIAAIDDPSNVSDRFDRARLRRALADVDWLDADRWTASAKALGDAEDAIGWTVRLLEGRLCEHGAGETVLCADGVPFELRRRLAERCLSRIDRHATWRGGEVAALVERLDAGRPATLGNVRCTPGRGPDGASCWRFAAAPPRRSR